MTQDKIDYRELLIKYIDLVSYEEGTTFIPDLGESWELDFGEAVTVDEVVELNMLQCEVKKRQKNRQLKAEIESTSLLFEEVDGKLKLVRG